VLVSPVTFFWDVRGGKTNKEKWFFLKKFTFISLFFFHFWQAEGLNGHVGPCVLGGRGDTCFGCCSLG
jgi:hypothetical protein